MSNISKKRTPTDFKPQGPRCSQNFSSLGKFLMKLEMFKYNKQKFMSLPEDNFIIKKNFEKIVIMT